MQGVSKALTLNPMVSKAFMVGGLLGAGDVLAQLGLERRQTIDYARTARFFAMGLAYGPALHLWYSRVLDVRFPTTSPRDVFAKLMLDQFVAAPLAITAVLSTVSLSTGHTLRETREHVREKFPSTFAANLALWLPAGYVNFRFVPPTSRVLFVGTVATAWNAYLSSVANSQARTHSQSRSEAVPQRRDTTVASYR